MEQQGSVFCVARLFRLHHHRRRNTRKSTKETGCRDLSLRYKNGGRGGRDRLRRGGGGRDQRGGCRSREKEEALLQGAPVHDVRIRRRPKPLHGVCGHPGGPGDRVHHGDDAQSDVDRPAGTGPGGGHRLPHPERPQKVRPSQRPADHERRAEESPEGFRRSQLWLLA